MQFFRGRNVSRNFFRAIYHIIIIRWWTSKVHTDCKNFFRFLIINHINRLIGDSDFKIIYRHYATLYFVFCVDSSESELGILDLIQVFVETLDKCFENVCELDLIFHVDKVWSYFCKFFTDSLFFLNDISLPLS